MAKAKTPGRANQRQRTRKDLLQAAARLLKQGGKPTMDEVAAEAMVSRATAYRYFPSLEALLVEAPLEGDAPDPLELFGESVTQDVLERIDLAEAALHEMSYRNEVPLRLMLAHTMQEAVRESGEGSGTNGGKPNAPRRQNRRGELIAAALAPVRGEMTKARYDRLSAALSLVLGTESMIVFRDVLPLKPAEARRVKSWAVRALVAAALEESR